MVDEINRSKTTPNITQAILSLLFTEPCIKQRFEDICKDPRLSEDMLAGFLERLVKTVVELVDYKELLRIGRCTFPPKKPEPTEGVWTKSRCPSIT